MSTVPKAGDPAPADNSQTHTISGAAGMYGRPANGGAPVAGKQEGNAPTSDAPAGPTPGYSISMTGAPVGTGDTQTGPDMGHGATQIVAEPNATGAGDTDNDGDTM